jgi:hypothetical protein
MLNIISKKLLAFGCIKSHPARRKNQPPPGNGFAGLKFLNGDKHGP